MKAIFDKLLRFIDRATLFGAWGAIAAIFLGFWIIIIDILMRILVGSSLSFGLEYSGYLVAISFFWGAGWALNSPSGDGHIRVNLLMERLSLRRARQLDLFASVIGLMMAALLGWAMIDWALGSMALGARSFYPSATQLFWPQILLALGPCLLALAFFAKIIRMMRGPE